MDYATANDELPGIFGGLLELPCAWRKQPGANVINTSASATLDVIASPSFVDELIVTREGEDAKETSYGIRELTLQVSVWSPSQLLGESARFFLERLRTRLQWTSTYDALKRIGFEINDILQIVTIDPRQAGRLMSGCAMDVQLGFGIAESDTPAPPIKSVHVVGQIDDRAGAIDLTTEET